MTLYIRFGDLKRFDDLHRGSDYLQDALTRHSAVKWEIAEGEECEVEKMLTNRGFNFEIV